MRGHDLRAQAVAGRDLQGADLGAVADDENWLDRRQLPALHRMQHRLEVRSAPRDEDRQAHDSQMKDTRWASRSTGTMVPIRRASGRAVRAAASRSGWTTQVSPIPR